jgi:hypothetical protein
MKKQKDLLPWFVNNTLDERETRSIEAWLLEDPDARAKRDSMQEMARTIALQKTATPSIQVRNNIITIIEKPTKGLNGFRRWLLGVPLAILFFALLWVITQPGHQLEWSVQGGDAVAFRIYRTSSDETNFEFVEELPATPSKNVYEFSDPIVIPGQKYRYLVEAVDQNGIISTSQITVNDSMLVFTAQFAILLTSFFLAFGIITLIEEFKVPQIPLAVI